MAKLFAIAVASLTALVTGDSFLAKHSGELLQEDVKQVLLSELLGHTDAARLQSIESDLQTMYIALPKSERGVLEFPTVRYALHRYFLQKYGWFVKGLDKTGESWNSTGTATVLKERASTYILSLFEEHLNGGGLGLHELAVFAATLTDLVHAEATGHLERIYAALKLPAVGAVDPHLAEKAMRSFVAAFLLGATAVKPIETEQDLQDMKVHLDDQYPNQEETYMWVDDLRHTFDLGQHPRRNPFVTHQPNFDDASAFVMNFGHNFGSFQNLECRTMKAKLVEMEHAGSGRVLLSTFYSHALAGAWEFMESVEYLRNQGALDESDPESPSIVIPNYMSSKMNCFTASDYFAVCCLNECDGLLGRLEARVAAPSAEPAVIAEIVSTLQSDTVDAPRNLSLALLDRLGDIAQHHGGYVPLHGRLFAQWMHHAYPRECPFPHVAGSVTSMYPVEFALTMGEQLQEVTQEVMELHASRGAFADSRPVVLPWSHEEELVAEHRLGSEARWGFPFGLPSLKAIVGLIALTSFAMPLIHALKVAFGGSLDSKLDAHLV